MTRRAALMFVALATLAADARPRGRFERTNSRTPQGRSDRGLPGDDPAFFEFAPASGAGLPYTTNLCDALQASEKVGNWWCLNGDGTMASGSQKTLSASGSPTASTDRVCSNGPDCASLTSRRLAAGSGYATTSDTNAPTSFTACLLFSPDDLANENFFGKGQTSAANTQWLIQKQTSGRVDFGVSDGTSFALYATGPANVAVIGGLHLACARYVYSGTPGLSSTAQSCLDGTCGTASTTATGPLNTASLATRIGYDAAYIYDGRIFGAFVVDADLGTARLAALARAVLADTPTGAKGEAMTFTRASTKFCASSDGTGSDLPNGRPCIAEGFIDVESSRVNYVLRSRELANLAWTAVQSGSSLPAVTSDYAAAPNGALTAERVQFGACPTAGNYSVIYQSGLDVGGAHISSTWCKSNTGGTQQISICTIDTGGAADRCTPITCTTSWQPFSDTSISVTGGGGLILGCDNETGVYSGASNTGAADVLLWNPQYEAGTYRTSPIATTSASATRAADQPSFAGIAGLASAGSVAATVKVSDVAHCSVSGCPVLDPSATSRYLYLYLTNARTFDSTNTAADSTTLTPGTFRMASSWSGSSQFAYTATTSGTSAFDGSHATTSLQVGFSSAFGTPIDGRVGRICADPNPARCR